MVMALERYEELEKELLREKERLIKKASDLINRLTSGEPHWSIQGIADKTGLSRVTISKIRSASSDVGMEAIRKVLGTDFDRL